MTNTTTMTIRKALSTAINSGKEATITVYRDMTADVTYGYGLDHLDAKFEATIPSLNWVLYNWTPPATPQEGYATQQSLIKELHHAQCKLELILGWLQDTSISMGCLNNAEHKALRADIDAVKEAIYAVSSYKQRVFHNGEEEEEPEVSSWGW